MTETIARKRADEILACATQREAAQVYARTMVERRVCPTEFPWHILNEAIQRRWPSPSSLLTVKRKAWKVYEVLAEESTYSRCRTCNGEGRTPSGDGCLRCDNSGVVWGTNRPTYRSDCFRHGAYDGVFCPTCEKEIAR